jgi:hypothetical protein
MYRPLGILSQPWLLQAACTASEAVVGAAPGCVCGCGAMGLWFVGFGTGVGCLVFFMSCDDQLQHMAEYLPHCEIQ